jgi:hypothetical protein
MRRGGDGGASVGHDEYVFISYSRDDGDYVDRLVDCLNAGGVRVWYDRLASNGVPWRETIAERVEQAAAVVLVELASAQTSRWVNEEFLYAEKNYAAAGDGPEWRSTIRAAVGQR